MRLHDTVTLLADACRTPIAAVRMLDDQWLHTLAAVGVDATQPLPRKGTFCDLVVTTDAPVVIADAHRDPRFRTHPLVVGSPGIRSFVGVPLHTDGTPVGTLCVLNTTIAQDHDRVLAILAAIAAHLDQELQVRQTLQDAEPLIAQATRYRQNLVAQISHEIRTPVTTIQGYLEVIADDPDALAPRYRPLLEPINRNVRRLCRTVDQLILAADAAATSDHTNMELLDLAGLVRASCARRAGTAHPVHLDLPAEPVPVHGNTAQLHIAVDNILTNAELFSPTPTAIEVQVSATPQPHLTVIDHGVGIPADELAQLGTPFYRGAHARHHHVPGIGLGLTITQQIIARHHGSMHLRSTPGQGTSITITLPGTDRLDDGPATA
ncbi:hypothetical protein GCM10020218_098580 [Dactylosporangium vinaceum]